jgi:hypothetical protein
MSSGDKQQGSTQTPHLVPKTTMRTLRDYAVLELWMRPPFLVLFVIFILLFGGIGFAYLIIAIGILFLFFSLYLLTRPSQKDKEIN